jgi:hypothetical protein
VTTGGSGRAKRYEHERKPKPEVGQPIRGGDGSGYSQAWSVGPSNVTPGQHGRFHFAFDTAERSRPSRFLVPEPRVIPSSGWETPARSPVNAAEATWRPATTLHDVPTPVFGRTADYTTLSLSPRGKRNCCAG